MKSISVAQDSVDFSLSNFESLFSFKKLFRKIKTSWEKEQKDLLFEKKAENEQNDYFNVMKFLFSSPDKV